MLRPRVIVCLDVKDGRVVKGINFLELRDYIADLQQSGFDTVPLQVQYQKKFSKPLFALIMALVSAMSR